MEDQCDNVLGVSANTKGPFKFCENDRNEGVTGEPKITLNEGLSGLHTHTLVADYS